MSGEKTFAPTEKRLRDAARRGDVLRSKDFATAATVLAGAAMLRLAGPWLLARLAAQARASLTWDHAAIENFAPGRMLLTMLETALPPVLLFAGGVLAVVLVTQLGFASGRWVPENLAPKPSRLNPLSGLARMFGANGWIEVGKGVLKVALLGLIAWVWARVRLAQVFALGHGAALGPQLAGAWATLTSLLLVLALGLMGIAMIDFPVQWLRRWQRLRMSLQELRDEHKEADGNPERKAAMRQRQRALATGAVAKAMRQAQFLITNPSHFSVAMAYDPERAAAPVVLAKGRGEKALAMRELAAELEVPMLEAPVLARSVYFTTRENQMIREELYAAVAAVLAFVLSLKRGEAPVLPPIEVPVALRFDAEGRLDPAASA